jgi:hypothetical protein
MSRTHKYVAMHAYRGFQRPGGIGGQGSLGPKPPPWSKAGRGGASAYVTTILADSPTFLWKLDETSGTTAYDASPNGINGLANATLGGTGSAIVNDSTASQLLYSAGTDYVEAVSGGAMSGAGDFTMEVWTQPKASPTNQRVFGCWGTSTSDQLCVISWTATGVLEWAVKSTSDGLYTASTGASYGSIGTTYHIMVTYSTTEGIALYVDGALIDTDASVFTRRTPIASVQPTLNQLDSSSSNNEGNAWYDMAAFYPTALSEAQALAHYNAGLLA